VSLHKHILDKKDDGRKSLVTPRRAREHKVESEFKHSEENVRIPLQPCAPDTNKDAVDDDEDDSTKD
jgi:hypothetical protein